MGMKGGTQTIMEITGIIAGTMVPEVLISLTPTGFYSPTGITKRCLKGQISGLQGEQSEVGGEIDELDTSVVEIIASVDIIKEEIVDKEEQIKVTEAEYDSAKAQAQVFS